ncbi:MAG: c-type cytochrome [Saprospiraceae bacterium]|nr:c-type cytochrome [Saprospiraceae bacterium]
MEKDYALASKLIALWASFACLGVLILMIQPIIKTPKSRNQIVCGNTLMPTFNGETGKKGKILFVENCAQCHAKNMKDRLTGPPLGDWRNYFSDEKEVTQFLNAPKKYRETAKNKSLRKLHKEYGQTDCTPVPNLTLEEVTAIFTYVNNRYH